MSVPARILIQPGFWSASGPQVRCSIDASHDAALVAHLMHRCFHRGRTLRITRLRWEYLRKEIIMSILLIIFIPLGALVIYAVVFDLKQRRHRGAPGRHDISSAARMARANADARGGSGLGGGVGVGGAVGGAVGGGGGPVG
jgi:hypothetical protein